MRRIWLAGLSLVFMACGNTNGTPEPVATSGGPGTVPPGNAVTVSIPQGATGRGAAAYEPNPLTISPGTTVTWVNNDAMAHTATSSSGVWDSQNLSPGQSYSFQFNSSGSFPYFCVIHGATSMSGTVTVR